MRWFSAYSRTRQNPAHFSRFSDRRALKPALLPLETRIVPAVITWDGGAGTLNWADAANWSGDLLPGVNDDAVIPNLAGNQTISLTGAHSVRSINHSENLLIASGGSLTLGVGASTLNAQLTVAAGGSLVASASANLSLAANQTLFILGNATFNPGAFITYVYAFNADTRVTVASGGTLTLNNNSLAAATLNSNTTRLLVQSGARLISSNSTLTLSRVEFEGGSTLNPGDVVANRFDSPLFIPHTHLANLSGPGNDNRRFQDINLLPATLASGTLNLDAIGTDSTANLRYSFSGNFTIATGAALNLAASIPVLLQPSTNLVISGNAAVAAGSSFTYVYAFQADTRLTVASGGTLNLASSALAAATLNSNTTRLIVQSGGRLISSDSTFTLSRVEFEAGSTLNPADLVANRFDSPLTIPHTHLPKLSGPGNDNRRFQDINILPSALTPGTLNLDAIGTDSTANLRYSFSGNFTVVTGATLNVAANVQVLLQPNALFTTSGITTFGPGSSLAFLYAFQADTRVTVASSGILDLDTTTFAAATLNSNTTRLLVQSGGRLIASDSTFNLTRLDLNPGAILNPGDLTANRFDSPLFLPHTLLPNLAGTGNENRCFQDINILPGSLTSGILRLDLIGSESTANLRYFFDGNFTVTLGTALNVNFNVPVNLRPNATLNVNGSTSFLTGSSLNFNYAFNAETRVIVAAGGVLNVTGSAFAAAILSSNTTRLVVNSGGRLNLNSSNLALTTLAFNSGASASLTNSVINTQFTVHSNTTLAASGNDFSPLIASSLIATGDPLASLDFRGNFWGTTVPAQIETKILHRTDDPLRPLVIYEPFTLATPATLAGLVFQDNDANGLRDPGEPGLPGVVLYLDLNNNQTLDPGEFTTTSIADDLTTLEDEAGTYRFTGLGPGTFIVRQINPPNAILVNPPAAQVATTITFDGTGNETGITGLGIGSFTLGAAAFSGGTIFNVPNPALAASIPLAYNATAGSTEVEFNRPVSSASFFYVHGAGFADGTATAFGYDGAILATAASKPFTTQADPANFVTLTAAAPIARITFSGAIIDSFSFTTPASDQAYYARLSPGESISNLRFANLITGTLFVQFFEPNPSGFTATFNQPLDPATLSLVDNQAGLLGPPDVTLTGNATGPVRGSLTLSPDLRTLAFTRTGGPLPADAYTLALRSGANGLVSLFGDQLDGNNDTIVGDDYMTTFSTSSPPPYLLSLPDLTRGPDQTADAPTGSGILPLNLNSGAGVFGVDLRLRYNPSLLTISSIGLGSALPADWEIEFNDTTPGELLVTASGLTEASPGTPLTLINLTASVPKNALYAAKHRLDLDVLDLSDAFGNPLPASADDAVHLVAYPGDTNGTGTVTAVDVTFLRRVIVGLDSGFIGYQMIDPTLVADFNTSGSLTAGDVTILRRFLTGLSQSSIPAINPENTITPSGLDPFFSLPKNLAAKPGDTITVPLNFLQTDSSPIPWFAFDAAIQFDPRLLTLLDVQPGDLSPADEFLVDRSLIPSQGIVTLSAAALESVSLDPGTSGTLAWLTFRVNANARPGSSLNLNLLDHAQHPTRGAVQTLANEGTLILLPAPTNSPDDPTDGRIAIRPRAARPQPTPLITSTINATPFDPPQPPTPRLASLPRRFASAIRR